MRRTRLALLAAVAALSPGPAVLAAPPADATAPHAVAAPHYGHVLFDFYQQRYFSALADLMVSQQFRRLGPHADEAEVLRGGLLLSYGMHREAAALFTQLIERHAESAVRDRAWYQLARIRHQRGLSAEAEEALAQIGAPLPGALEEDRRLLQAQLLMARQEPARAAAVLEPLATVPGAGFYVRFNHAVALVNSGEAERGKALLDELGRTPAADDEMRSVRDQANLALGLAALREHQPRDARLALQRVRLAGTQANRALLAHGWAAAELKDPQLALAPWTELAGRNLGDPAVLEAQIALPYAMSEIGAYRLALARYEDAVALFERERHAIDEAIAAVRNGELVRRLLADNPGPANESGLGSFGEMARLPALPLASQLAPLMADHEFQEAYKNLRDLQFIAANLARWQGSLGAFGDMLDNRRQAFAERLPLAREKAGAAQLDAWQQRLDVLNAQVEAALAQSDAGALASERERRLQRRIASARRLQQGIARPQSGGAVVGPTPADAAMSDAAERLRRAAGALVWQQMQEFPTRGWEIRKALRDSAQALASARQHDAALQQAQREEPVRLERFGARITELGDRLQALLPQVAELDGRVRAQLQDVAVAGLQRLQQRLEVYTAQARLAMAQIHDHALLGQRGDKAAGGAAR